MNHMDNKLFEFKEKLVGILSSLGIHSNLFLYWGKIS